MRMRICVVTKLPIQVCFRVWLQKALCFSCASTLYTLSTALTHCFNHWSLRYLSIVLSSTTTLDVLLFFFFGSFLQCHSCGYADRVLSDCLQLACKRQNFFPPLFFFFLRTVKWYSLKAPHMRLKIKKKKSYFPYYAGFFFLFLIKLCSALIWMTKAKPTAV